MWHTAPTGGLGPAISVALLVAASGASTIPVHALGAQDSTKTSVKSWGVVYSSPRSRQQAQQSSTPTAASTAPATTNSASTVPAGTSAPTTLPQIATPSAPVAAPPAAPAQTTVLPSITGTRTYGSYSGDVAPAAPAAPTQTAPVAAPQVTYAVPAPTYAPPSPAYVPPAPAYTAPAPAYVAPAPTYPAAPPSYPAAAPTPPVYAGDPAPATTASAPATYPTAPPPPQYGTVSTLTVDTNPPPPPPGSAAAGSSTIRLDEMMSLHEWDASGAARLKPQELAVLERWIERYRAALIDSTTRLAAGQPAAPRIVAPNPGGTVHAKDAHQVAAIKAGSRYITLDDNSVWDIYSSDQTETAAWQPGDWVQVRLASIAYGDYDHELVNNQRTGPVRAKFMGYAKPDVAH
jgi:hypothetical protein